MKQWGDEIILATAVFWADRVEWDEDGRVCHIRDGIGPDEYKQRLTDNTYTNYMARNNLRLAVQIAERLEKEDPEYLEELNNRWEICEMLPKIRRAAEGIYLPPVGKDGILPQFAGYGKLQEMDLSYYKSFGKNAAAEMRKEHRSEDIPCKNRQPPPCCCSCSRNSRKKPVGHSAGRYGRKTTSFMKNTRSMKHPTALPPIP